MLPTLGVDEDVQAEKLSVLLLGLHVTTTTENSLSPWRKAEDIYNYGPVILFLHVYPRLLNMSRMKNTQECSLHHCS